MNIVLSCEHATNSIPERWEWLFRDHQALLESHRGIDFGASLVASHLAEHLSCVCIQASASRLLIDCNRSLGHPNCFSEITKFLPESEKQIMIQGFYLPYRRAVEHTILEDLKERKKVFHFSIHSFTPVMNQIIRKTDIGLLYDPGRPREKMLAKRLKQTIKMLAPELRVRMNYPYLGTSNGFTTALRRVFVERSYTGIEIEINQAITGHSFEHHGKIITVPPTADFEKIKQVLAMSMDLL